MVMTSDPAMLKRWPGTWSLVMIIWSQDKRDSLAFLEMDKLRQWFPKVADANLAPNFPKGEIGPLLLVFLN